MRWITANTERMRRYRAESAQDLRLDHVRPPIRAFFERHAERTGTRLATLAGNVGEWIRQQLMLRNPEGPMPKENREENSQAFVDFLTNPHTQERQMPHWSDLLAAGFNTGFHWDTQGHADVKRDASFRYHYYHKGAMLRRLEHGDVRAYVVLKPEIAGQVAKHFAEMAGAMVKQGLLFEGKAGTPNLVRIRKDHMVFYIDRHDQEEAKKILERYLTRHKIGSDEKMVAQKGGAAGLWWAPSPDAEEERIAQTIGGGIGGEVSHHRMAALALTAEFMKRLARAHRQTGNKAEADAFEAEARRVEAILR
ncbi:hypothetical protein HYV43_06920 [Candidatus Micrarchaeota archaeon]|nr:hypothetical protein [Candidatus Micrarchaeota archaeon]